MIPESPDPTARFSDRVADYVRYRPSYPPELFEALRGEFGLGPGQTAADIGSGTGIFSGLLLERGLTVFAVEPNEAMREAAEWRLEDRAHFTSVAAPAEATTLPSGSMDWIFAAQAFHWLDVGRCRVEFGRILRPNGRVVLVWNNRRHDTPFLREYERLLCEHGTDYRIVRHEGAETDGRIKSLYAPRSFELRTFPNEQRLDFEGLRGRTFSSSYTPPPGDARRGAIDGALVELFRRHERQGAVTLSYETRMYVGRLG